MTFHEDKDTKKNAKFKMKVCFFFVHERKGSPTPSVLGTTGLPARGTEEDIRLFILKKADKKYEKVL